MVKVKVLQPYKDKQKMLLFQKDEVHEVDKVRADELVQKGLVEIVTEPEKLTKETEREK